MIAESRLEAVTVYRQGAVCERWARVEPHPGSGDREIRIGGLPLSLSPGTMRARIEGGEGTLRVLDVRPGWDVGAAAPPATAADQTALHAAEERSRSLEAEAQLIEKRDLGDLAPDPPVPAGAGRWPAAPRPAGGDDGADDVRRRPTRSSCTRSAAAWPGSGARPRQTSRRCGTAFRPAARRSGPSAPACHGAPSSPSLPRPRRRWACGWSTRCRARGGPPATSSGSREGWPRARSACAPRYARTPERTGRGCVWRCRRPGWIARQACPSCAPGRSAAASRRRPAVVGGNPLQGSTSSSAAWRTKPRDPRHHRRPSLRQLEIAPGGSRHSAPRYRRGSRSRRRRSRPNNGPGCTKRSMAHRPRSLMRRSRRHPH